MKNGQLIAGELETENPRKGDMLGLSLGHVELPGRPEVKERFVPRFHQRKRHCAKDEDKRTYERVMSCCFWSRRINNAGHIPRGERTVTKWFNGCEITMDKRVPYR